MHPRDCPKWEYSNHPQSDTILTWAYVRILSGLRRGQIDTLENAVDTREIHRQLFHQLIPPNHSYYAGHYRGENYRCLRYYSTVGIEGDPTVGCPAPLVSSWIDDLTDDIRTTVAEIDAKTLLPEAQFPLSEKLKYAVAFAARIFEFFLRIHPYVNGNGHAARFIIWALLGRYGFWPASYPIHPRPLDPPYTPSIILYRRGNREPLETFILRCLELQNN